MSGSLSVDLAVIIPAYNEADRLPRTLQRIQEYLADQVLTYEIIVVLDGPTDATLSVVRKLGEKISNLKVIERAVNRGKGYSVREGILAARGRIRLFTDADNSTDIAHLANAMDLFDAGNDVVIASRSRRDIQGARQAVSQAWHKRTLGQLGNLWVQLIAVPGIWDTQCGFKAFRAEAAQRIFAQAQIDHWAFDIEVLALARAMNYRIGIIPARWMNDERTNVHWFDYVGVLRDTLKVRLNLSAGRYRLVKYKPFNRMHELMRDQTSEPADRKPEKQK